MIRIHCRDCPVVSAAQTVMDALRANDLHADEVHSSNTDEGAHA